MSCNAGTWFCNFVVNHRRSDCFGYLLLILLALESISTCSLPALGEDDRRQAAIERVPRHRSASVALRKVTEYLRPNADIEVLRVAQQVLDLETDWLNEDLESVHLLVESRLRQADQGTLRKYESLVGVDADRLLKAATEELSVGKLREICRRYSMTAAGYAAAERLVALWFDAGDYELAAQLADRVLNEPVHRPRITAQFRSMVLDLKRILQVSQQGAIIERRVEANGRAGEVSTETGVGSLFYQEFLKHRQALQPLNEQWIQLGGDFSRSRIVGGSMPVPAPIWSADFFATSAMAGVPEFLADWEGARRDVDQPICPAVFPLIVGNRLIFRDSTGIRAVNAVNGKAIWSYRCNSNPTQPISRSELMMRRRFMSGGQNPFGENTLMGAISSDGHRVYAIDSTLDVDTTELQETGQLVRQFRNRLVAIAAAGPSQGTISWINEGLLPKQFRKPDQPEQFSFLGGPLPGVTELLALTGYDDEIHLAAFDPHSGRLLWRQPLCTIDRAEQFDPERYETACLLARSQGVIVCPTNTGMLVAVDQARMNLMWATFVDDPPDLKRFQVRGNIRNQPQSYGGYASHVVIDGNRLVYLPPRSSQIHCLDLFTGKLHWSIPRGDAEFVGAIADGCALVVGRQGCRGLKLMDGHEVWRSGVGMPVACGVAIGDKYVLPLEQGRLAAIDIKTGHDHGTKALRSETELGHLVADRDRVYSVNQRGVLAFPQVDHVLASVKSSGTAGALRDVMLAEVGMVQGSLRDAERQLRVVVASHDSPLERARARKDLKELLFLRLEEAGDISVADQETLNELLETPTEQFRFLISASRLSRGVRLVEQFGQRAYDLPANATCPVPGFSDWTISSTAWCRLQLSNAEPTPFYRQLQQLRETLTSRLPAETSIKALKRFVEVFDDQPGIEAARQLLAARFAASGEIQSAETLLLRNQNSNVPEFAAEATHQLMELWENSGFIVDAARQLDLLSTKYASIRLSSGLSGASFVRQLSVERPAKRVWLQSLPPSWPVTHAEISQTAVAREFVEPYIPVPPPGREQSRFQLSRDEIGPVGRYSRVPGQAVEFVTSPSESEDQYTITFFDQRSKLRLGFLTVPQLYRTAISDKVSSAGHLLPFGVPGGMLGVSTLQLGDGDAVWKHFPKDLAGRKSTVIPGPHSCSFASYVWRNRLFVIDALDGSLLWQRLIATPMPDPRLEVFGDEQALVVQIPEATLPLNSDRKLYYEVYETATGKKLSTVRTGFLANQWQGCYGRFAMGSVDSAEGRRLQIRDLTKESPSVSEAISDQARQPIVQPGGELIYMGPGGEIKIFDILRGVRNLSVQLGAAEMALPVNTIRVLSDQSRYYINLQRHVPTATTAHFNLPLNNVHLPSQAIRDDLYAFDKSTGELLWKRALPNRTILQFQDSQVPFLVAMSLVKDRVNNSLQSLTVEVIDSASGATIGYRDNLTSDHLLSADYDGMAGRILIRGQTTDLEIRFGPAEGQTGANADRSQTPD